MRFSNELHDKLIATMAEKFGRIRPCPVCGQDQTFQLMPNVTNLPFMENATSFESDAYTACLALVCLRCGCTHLLNANVLGIRDMISAEGMAGSHNDAEGVTDG
jgi:hypothetical protein